MSADCNDSAWDRLEADWSNCDTRAEHEDYEVASAYDRYDGWGDCDVDPGCPVCGDRGDCAECIAWKDRAAQAYRDACEARAACNDSDDIPF